MSSISEDLMCSQEILNPGSCNWILLLDHVLDSLTEIFFHTNLSTLIAIPVIVFSVGYIIIGQTVRALF